MITHKECIVVSHFDVEEAIKESLGIDLDVSSTLFGDCYYNDSCHRIDLTDSAYKNIDEHDKEVKLVYDFLMKQFPYVKEILIDTSW